MDRLKKAVFFLVFVGLASAMPLASATAEDEEQFMDKAYARLGLAIGWPNIDSGIYSGSTGAGLSFVGGYNIQDGLAAEVEFVFTAGTNAESRKRRHACSAPTLYTWPCMRPCIDPGINIYI